MDIRDVVNTNDKKQGKTLNEKHLPKVINSLKMSGEMNKKAHWQTRVDAS